MTSILSNYLLITEDKCGLLLSWITMEDELVLLMLDSVIISLALNHHFVPNLTHNI